MADLPIDLPAPVAERLARALDVEGKIPRALETLGPMGGRDVLLVDVPEGIHTRRIRELGARLQSAPAGSPLQLPVADGSVDAVVSLWSAFRGVEQEDIAEAERVLRPGGRLLVVHEYGRDDVAHLRPADLPEYTSWGRRDGPFLGSGFRIRVIHCFWTFPSLDEQAEILREAFGEPGAEVAALARRPRLTWNVAVYHRTRSDGPSPD